MKRKLMLLLTCLFVGIGLVTAQTQKVTGTVISEEDGLPVVGASILVKGTTVGTITDVDGQFTLSNIPSSAKVLQISYIGMQSQEVAIKPTVKVVLKSDAEILDEVVVVAYGTAKKGSFTGSASSVSGEKVSKLQVSSVSKALEGAAPGIQVINQSGQPGENAKIRIRGVGSFSASSAPLYVVDGMPFNEEAVNTINPADIESISVLKDAASASLYGSRAANGVVMITTKKGKAAKTKVSVDARWGINSRGIPEYNIMKDPGEYLKTYWTVLKNQENATFASENLISDLGGYNPYINVANNAVVSTSGELTSAKLKYTDDWADETLKNGVRQEYNINLQGGNDKTNHYLSLGYLTDEGILRNTDFDRFSARANINHTVNNLIDLGTNLSYARTEKNAGSQSSLSNYSNAFMFTQKIAPIYPVYAYDASGNRLYNDDGSVIYDFGDGTYGSRMGGFSNQNSAATSSLNRNESISDNFNGRGFLNLKLFNDFKFSVNAGYDVLNSLRTLHMNKAFGDAQKVGGRTYKYNNRYETFTANQLLSYVKRFNDHNIDVMLGHESYSYKRSYQYTHKYGFYVNDNPEFNNAITMGDMDSYVQEHSMESWFGRINYDFLDRYYLSGSLRTDESSKFHPDHRRGTFWSVGGSWRMSQEDFMKSLDWISDLKLRASYGTQGNDGILDEDKEPVYQPYMKQYAVSNNNGSFSLVETYRGNKELTWETSYNFNIGAEIGLWDNRLKVELEYFNKKTVDMLYNMPYPISSGISYVPMNLLDMRNQGVEFTVSGSPIKTRDLTWNVSFNGTHYKNKILNLPEEKRANGITHSTYYRLMEGGTVYDFFTYEYAGVDPANGDALWYMDVKGTDGSVTKETTNDYTKATKYDLGTALPDFIGAFSTDITYKGFDLAISTNFQLGGQILDAMYMSAMHAGSSPGENWHKDILNSWTETNQNTDVPVLDGAQNSNSVSSRFLIGASFFNLRNITLGYTFPSNWLKSLTATNARIYISADNVALFSKRKGMDPRQYLEGQSQANYSAIRALSFGVSLNF
ncbi:TonB-dependent receptor [Bacteroides graminisolvens]|uniref:SusC/RagA family TonB-linked outer membrane protein n=1 Tax=Bacteroides graminisolvens TaxID=477666 RepID=UPI0029C8D68F|nr:TonB-dependent receptor [Bacteroides graminisolvens]